MLKNKITTSVIAGGLTLVGIVAGIATMASAQTSTTSNNSAVVTSSNVSASAGGSPVDTPESANDPADVGAKTQGHAPLGGDGIVSSITGTTIVMIEESNEGSASYTIDASKATVSNNGTSATLADIKVGGKVFVKGTTNGTNVTATSISVGDHGGHMDKANDTDGNSGAEASEPAGSSDTAE